MQRPKQQVHVPNFLDHSQCSKRQASEVSESNLKKHHDGVSGCTGMLCVCARSNLIVHRMNERMHRHQKPASPKHGWLTNGFPTVNDFYSTWNK